MAPLLEVSNVAKTFPGVRALKGVGLSIKRGEVLGLMGENGAGKSTLLKILSGFYQPDPGAVIRLEGEKLVFTKPKDAQIAGISTIHQELDLIPQLPTYENIFIGWEPRKRGMISHRKMLHAAREMFDEMGVDVDEKALLGEQSPARQQLTSIARALQLDAKVVIMDEPTSSLDENETQLLFRIIKKLKEKGTSVIFVSHRLSEVYAVCDRITILRDGDLVGTYEAEDLSEYDLITKMVGHSVDPDERSPRPSTATEVLVRATDLSTNRLNGVSLELCKGEVTGLAGLLGSGRTEVARAIYGADLILGGDVEVNGKKQSRWSIRKAIANGLAYSPEERRADGIFPNMSVANNIAISAMKHISRFGIINNKKKTDLAAGYAERLRVRTPSLNHPVANLSGGNQQKVILSRWLATQPSVLILDEPTRGIDVGVKSEVESLIRELAEDGLTVLLISSEFPELLRNSEKLIVMRDGKNIDQFNAIDASQERIMHAIAASHESFAENGEDE